jgi:hypothetical protein
MTGYGFCGPMTAMGTTFDAKTEGEAPIGRGRMLLLGAGSWLIWFLINHIGDFPQ